MERSEFQKLLNIMKDIPYLIKFQGETVHANSLLNKGEISILGESYYDKDTLYLKNNFKYLLRKNEESILKLKFEINKKRKYKSGDKVGIVKVYLGDKVVHEEGIYVKKGKEKENFWNKILSWFKHD